MSSEWDYEYIFQKAEEFAEEYSPEIKIDDSHKELITKKGIKYPCVPLSFPAKGNKDLHKRLLDTGCCTKMDGRIENGKRIINVLLWFAPDGKNVL